MKRKNKKGGKLNKAQKVEVILASFFTLVLFVAISVYAWFALSNNLETMTKVKEPDNLDIRAGNFQPIINFDLNGINIEEMAKNQKPEYRVFSVSAGDYKIAYKIQLAYTTNIPFKYSLYRAKWRKDVTEQDPQESYVEYHPINDSSTISYYELEQPALTLTALNPNIGKETEYGRIIAKNFGTLYRKTYDDSSDKPEIYSVPMYCQTAEAIIPSSRESEDEHDYFVLKIEWDSEAADKGFTKWNKAENNKETDIICITASRSTN